MAQTILLLQERLEKEGIVTRKPQAKSKELSNSSHYLSSHDNESGSTDSDNSEEESNSDHQIEDSLILDQDGSEKEELEEIVPVPHSPENPWGLRSLENSRKIDRPKFEKISPSDILPNDHPHRKYPLLGNIKIGLIGARGTGKTSYLKALSKISFDLIKYQSGTIGVQNFSILVDIPFRYANDGSLASVKRKRIILEIIDYPGHREISIAKDVQALLLFGTSEQFFSGIISGRVCQRIISRCDLMSSNEIPSGTKLARMKNPPIYISSVTNVNLLVPLEKVIESIFGKIYQSHFPVKI